MFAWLMLAVLLALGCSWLSDVVLWAQEGALDQAAQLEKQREKAKSLAGSTAQPSAPAAQPSPPAAGAQVTYEQAAPPGQAAANRWGNMNWFALYLVFAVPTTYFVFRGAGH
jgi:hypothetical protein